MDGVLLFIVFDVFFDEFDFFINLSLCLSQIVSNVLNQFSHPLVAVELVVDDDVLLVDGLGDRLKVADTGMVVFVDVHNWNQ